MAKRKFKLTEAERKELLRGYQAGKDAGTRTRYQAVRLYGEGYAEQEIEQVTGCSRTSLMEWCQAYRADHSQGLVDHELVATAPTEQIADRRITGEVASIHAQGIIWGKCQHS